MPSSAAATHRFPLAPRQVGGAFDAQHREAALLMACELAARAHGTSVLHEWEALCPRQLSAHAHATPSAHAGPGLLVVEMAGAELGGYARDARDAGGDAAPSVHGPRQWVMLRGASTIEARLPQRVPKRVPQLANAEPRAGVPQPQKPEGSAQHTAARGSRHASVQVY